MAVSPYAAGTRSLELSGAITTSTGQQIALTQSDISSYSINDSISGTGLALGGTAAATFNLSIRNANRRYSPSDFDNAEVHMRLRLDSGAYRDFGVWYVESSDASEQSVFINLSGSDAMKTRFEAEYTDNGTYPMSLLTLLGRMADAAGITLATGISFINSGVQIAKKPKWEEKTTLRRIIGYIAACAGGFAHINRAGKLEVRSFNRNVGWELGPSAYRTFSMTGGQAFNFKCLQVRFGDDEDYTSYVTETGVTENAANTLQIEGNPLITDAMANAVATAFKTTLPELEACEVTWGGDPSIEPGDRVTVTNLKGEQHLLMILSQSYSFDGGLSVRETCSLPSVTEDGDSYSTAGGTFDSNGNVRAVKISGLESQVVAKTAGHFSALTADTISTDELLASIINAVTLRAKNISATTVTADILTTMTAEIFKATIRKLQSETITTDELVAGIAELTAAKIKQLTAESIETDRLAGALADFGVITAKTATFDKATVKHLISQALQVKDAVGDKVMISNLTVDYATMVNANVGNLVIRASDGKYYRLDVSSTGTVSGVEQTVTDSEIEAGVTTGGKTIIDTQIAASDLSATNIKGVYALINRIDAARIDVDTLTARQAFIEYLQTADISSNTSIRFALNGSSTVYRNEEQPVEAKANDLWVVPSTGFIYQKLLTDTVPEGYSFDVTAEMILNHTCPEGAQYVQPVSDGSLIAVYPNGAEVQFTLNDDGTITATSYQWMRVKDSELSVAQKNALAALEQSGETASEMAEMRRYMEFDDSGLKQYLPGSIYYTLIDNVGFNVRSTKLAEPIATMNATDGVKAERVTMGSVTCNATSSGGWVWQEV